MEATTAHARINDVLVDYAFYADRNDPSQLSELFATDGSLNLGLGIWAGRSEIVRGISSILAEFCATLHVISNTRIEVDGGNAKATAYVTAWHWLNPPTPDGPADLVILGTYLDKFVHVDFAIGLLPADALGLPARAQLRLDRCRPQCVCSLPPQRTVR